MNALNDIKDLEVELPDGAFYVMPDISMLYGRSYLGNPISSAKDLCDLLLEHAHIAVVPGEGFGAPDRVRISYAASEDKLTEALNRMAKFIAKLN